MDSANSDPAVSRSQQKQTLNIVSVNVIDSELSKNDQRICNKKANEINKKKNKKKWERRQSAGVRNLWNKTILTINATTKYQPR